MALAGKRERRSLWIAAVPMALLALSCVYPILFALNNALKTSKGYILDRFGLVTEPTTQNFVDAWGRARFSEYFLNSILVTAGAVGSSCSFPLWRASLWRCCAFRSGARSSWQSWERS
jgi:multiple sugar transport system permease protein